MAAKGKSVLAGTIFGLLCFSCIVTTILGLCSNSGSDVVPTLTANPNRKDGTAVYILLDVSGSMQDSVPNDKGQSEPKLDIAKRSAIDVCTAIAKYADEDKTRNIQAAMASFSDDYIEAFAMGKPDVVKMTAAINGLSTRGGTAIGDAVVHAQKALDQSGLKSQHILIITDGENNTGVTPENAAKAITSLQENLRPSVYVVAFDVNADVFNGVKSQGWQVFSAANGKELRAQLDEVVGGHILLER